MEKKTRLEMLKMRERQVSHRESAFEQPGALKKIRRNIRKLEKQLKD